jgi:tape measure domain-containing protein
MDVSHLQIKVTASGITGVSTKLDELGKKAEAAERKVGSLTQAIDGLINKQGALSQAVQNAAKSQITSLGDVNKALGLVSQNLQHMIQMLGGLANAQAALAQSSSQVTSGLQKHSQWGNVWTSTLKAMITAAGTYLSLNFAKGVLEAADSWVAMQAKLRIATGTMNMAVATQKSLYDMAQRVRVPLEDMGRLYQRLSVPLEKLGKTSEETAKHLEFIALGLKVSGATAEEASSVMLQYSQSINAGRLNGAEFNAVAEGSPIILRAIYDHLMKTSKAFRDSGGDLKKWASDGKITTSVLQATAEATLPLLQKQMESIPVTIDDALLRIRNSWTKTVGEIGQDRGLSQKFVAALREVEDMIPKMAKTVVDALAWVADNFRTLIMVASTLVTIGIVKWAIEGGVALLSMAAAANAAAAASTAAAAAGTAVQTSMTLGAAGAGIARVALGALGGPLGIILTLLSAGATAWALWGNKAETASGQATAVTHKETTDIIADLDRQIEKYKEREKWRSMNVDPDKGTEAERRLAELKKEYDTATQNKGDYATMPETLKAEKIRLLTQEYGNLASKIKAVAGLHEADMAEAKANQLKKIFSDFHKLTLTKDDHAQDEIDNFNERLGEIGEKLTKTQEDMIRAKFKVGSEAAAASKSLLKQLNSEIKTIKERNDALTAHDEGVSEDSHYAKAAEKARQIYRDIQANEEAIGDGSLNGVKLSQAHIESLKTINSLLALQASKTLELGQAEDAAVARHKAAEEAAHALDKLNAYLDPAHAEKFGDAFVSAFGRVGKAISKTVSAVSEFYKKDMAAQKAKDAAAKAYANDELGYFTATKQIETQQQRDRLDAVADLLQATKGYFKEHTAAYKLLELGEQSFRAYQAAKAVENGALELGIIDATTAARVEGYIQSAIESVKSTAIQIAQALGLGEVLAALGIATQAQGEPYTAWARMAVMAGTMAALGLAVHGMSGHGGSSGNTNQGTGTVLGDENAKSQSIKNSLDALADVDKLTMEYSAQMASSLKNIESSLAGVTNFVLRGSISSGQSITGIGKDGLTQRNSGDPIANMIGLGGVEKFLAGNTPFMGKIIDKLQGLWGKTTKEVINSGLTIKGTLQQLLLGQGMGSFADVKTSKSSLFGLIKSNSTDTQYSGIDPALAKQFSLVFDSFNDALKQAAVPLGVSLDSISTRLSGFVVDMGKIDLHGLTGDQIQEKLEAVFGAAADRMAEKALPGFEDFQKAGEGYLQTVVRVSSGVEQANFELDKLGISAVSVASILNKQGDVGGELTKLSIIAKEGSTGISEIIDTLTGSAAEIASTYKSLDEVRWMMKGTGLGSNLNRDLLKAAGGLEAMRDALSGYQDKFFSEAEKKAAKGAKLASEFAKLNEPMPTTIAGFRQLVDTLQGQGKTDLAMQVILLANAFADWADTATTASQAVEDARSNLTDSYNREKQALQDTKSKFDDFTKSLQDFHSSLLTGELSPLSNTEKYGTLSNNLDSTFQKAMSGDQEAIQAFQSVANEFLQFSQQYNASGDQYNADFQRVLDETAQLEEFTNAQSSVAQQQLDALDQQVQQLITINESVLTVAQAIDALNAALAAQTPTPASAPVLGASAPTAAIPATPSQANAMMVDQLNTLNASMQSLQQQTAANTQAIVAATVGSSEQNAQTIVDGVSPVPASRVYTVPRTMLA